MSWSEDGKYLAVYCRDDTHRDEYVHIIDVAKNKSVKKTKFEFMVCSPLTNESFFFLGHGVTSFIYL